MCIGGCFTYQRPLGGCAWWKIGRHLSELNTIFQHKLPPSCLPLSGDFFRVTTYLPGFTNITKEKQDVVESKFCEWGGGRLIEVLLKENMILPNGVENDALRLTIG